MSVIGMKYIFSPNLFNIILEIIYNSLVCILSFNCLYVYVSLANAIAGVFWKIIYVKTVKKKKGK